MSRFMNEWRVIEESTVSILSAFRARDQLNVLLRPEELAGFFRDSQKENK